MEGMIADYIPFYLDGRDAKRLKVDIACDLIANDVAAGKGTIHELLTKAVTTAAQGAKVGRSKALWLDEYETEIKEAGGDGEAAYEHYMQGRIDELVVHLEPEVLGELEAEYGDDEEDDEDDEGDDE